MPLAHLPHRLASEDSWNGNQARPYGLRVRGAEQPAALKRFPAEKGGGRARRAHFSEESTASKRPVGRPSMLRVFFSRWYVSTPTRPLASAQRVSVSRSPW